MQTTRDAFLDGRVTVDQPSRGFRSGADAVLLAAAVPADPGQSVLELGLGVGVGTLCLAARVGELEMAGLEIQPAYAQLAGMNAALNGVEIDIYEGDVATPPAALGARTFDHVFMNPPYYRATGHSASPAPDRATALGEGVVLEKWLDTATRRLRPGGWLTVIQKAPRLTDVLRAANNRLGSCEIKPVASRRARPAELVILRFRKGGRADPVLFPPLVMHSGDQHKQDTADPSPIAQDILRHAKKLEF